MEKKTKNTIFRALKRLAFMLVCATVGYFIAGITGIVIGLVAGTGISSPGFIGGMASGPTWPRK